MTRAFVFLILSFISSNIFSQSPNVTALDLCECAKEYEGDISMVISSFEKKLLKIKVSELQLLKKEEIDSFISRIYQKTGYAHQMYEHTNGKEYDYPENPICDLFKKYITVFHCNDWTLNRIYTLTDSLRLPNMKLDDSISNKCRVWQLNTHNVEDDILLDISIDSNGFLTYHYLKLNYGSHLLDPSIEILKSGNIKKGKIEQVIQGRERMMSFIEIPNTYLSILDGCETIIEIKTSNNYNVLVYPNIKSYTHNMEQLEIVRLILSTISEELDIELLY